ncbi:hypothetical protein [Alcaligenes faecalis]|uniref:hypothetical protein n=1 Tax=Alcaligenes faecalis TaxID=511 RepID=UPI00214FE149|nr:hypothetical protein [Alcaligenes faecalis]MCR4144078.1 hypothetical protein [Alcaligenes faecalis]
MAESPGQMSGLFLRLIQACFLASPGKTEQAVQSPKQLRQSAQGVHKKDEFIVQDQ